LRQLFNSFLDDSSQAIIYLVREEWLEV